MNPGVKTKFLILALLLAVLFAAPRHASAEGDAYIDQVLLTRRDGLLYVDFTVKNIVARQFVEALDSGLPVRFVYNVRFVRKAAALTTAVLKDIHFERVIEKDNLKNTYAIKENQDNREVADFAAAIDLLGTVKALPVTPVSDMLPEKRYQLEIQVKLEEFRLPFQLHRILPFFSLWDVTTPVKTVRITGEQADGK